MALQSSGAISLLDIAGEFGGSAPHSLSEYYGAAAGVPSSGTIRFSDFYGTSSSQTFIISSNQSNVTTSGLGMSSGDTLVINSGVYVYSTSVSNAALIVDTSNITITNNGYIIGKGGEGGMALSNHGNGNGNGESGGPAIQITQSGCSLTNTGTVGGGGGGGSHSRYGSGGGGAGGGDGGQWSIRFTGGLGATTPGGTGQDGDTYSDPSKATSRYGKGGSAGGSGGYDDDNGSDTGFSQGGGGGMAIPGVGGVSTGTVVYGGGGSGNGAGQNGYYLSDEGFAGGGGGWGAAGGNVNDANGGTGGSGGAAISTSLSYTLSSNTGNLWGTY